MITCERCGLALPRGCLKFCSRACRIAPKAICACGCGRIVKYRTSQFYDMSCRKKPCALCLCGCGRRVKYHYRKFYEWACIPRGFGADPRRRGRKKWAYQKRTEKFGELFTDLRGKNLTREDLFVLYQQVYQKGYRAGWEARRHGWKKAIQDVA